MPAWQWVLSSVGFHREICYKINDCTVAKQSQKRLETYTGLNAEISFVNQIKDIKRSKYYYFALPLFNKAIDPNENIQRKY